MCDASPKADRVVNLHLNAIVSVITVIARHFQSHHGR